MRTMLTSKIHRATVTILIGYGVMDEPEATSYLPKVVHVDAANRVVELGADAAAPAPGMTGQVRGDMIAG